MGSDVSGVNVGLMGSFGAAVSLRCSAGGTAVDHRFRYVSSDIVAALAYDNGSKGGGAHRIILLRCSKCSSWPWRTMSATRIWNI